jgi:hypothetical protein
MDTTIQQLEDDQRRLRREVLIRQVAHTLRATVQLRGLTPETAGEDVRVDFTDASARVLAPLCEAVEILEAIIFASDGCVGHRHCAHSMEPWQRARALLQGKWDAYEQRAVWPGDIRRCAHCGMEIKLIDGDWLDRETHASCPVIEGQAEVMHWPKPNGV